MLRFVAFGTWQIGLLEFLKDSTEPSVHVLQSSAETMAEWLGRLGKAIHKHRSHDDYQDQRRLGGSSHGESALGEDDFKRKRELEWLLWEEAEGRRLREGVDGYTIWYNWLFPPQ